jgi:hypothetical protein
VARSECDAKSAIDTNIPQPIRTPSHQDADPNHFFALTLSIYIHSRIEQKAVFMLDLLLMKCINTPIH